MAFYSLDLWKVLDIYFGQIINILERGGNSIAMSLEKTNTHKKLSSAKKDNILSVFVQNKYAVST